MQVMQQPGHLSVSESEGIWGRRWIARRRAVMLVSRGRWRVFGRRVGHAGCIWSDDMGVA